MTSEMLSEVQDDGTMKDATTIWKHLKDLHEVLEKGRAFLLKNTSFSIKMNGDESLHEHLVKIKNIREHLNAIGRKMEEEDMVVIIFKSLLVAFEHFIETFSITATDKSLKFDELCRKLLLQDRWKKHFGS